VTLVLLTPIGLDAGCWEWMETPAGAVAKHTFPGFGGRPRARERPTMASLADEVVAAYDPPLDLVGVSLGGMVALHATLRHQPRVRSLMVCCTGAASDPETMEGRAQAAERDGMAGVLAVTLARWFTAGFLGREPQPAPVAYARRTLLALDPACFADGWRAIAGHDAVDRLGEIAVPTTALAGSADAASSVARSREIAERVAGARFVELDGPHMMQLEHPLELGAEIAEHLAWVAAA
jgi:3-oxoadipate enol-lactonase